MWKAVTYKNVYYNFYISKSLNYEKDKTTTIYFNKKQKDFFHNQYKKNLIKKGYEILEILDDRLIVKKD